MKLSREIFLIMTAVAAAFGADLDRGKQLYQDGKYADAVTELRQVVQDDAENADALRYLGLALIEQDKAGEAAKYITKADEVAPSGETKLAVARLYAAQKDFDKAEAALADASGDDVDYVRGLVNLNKQKYEDAAENFESYLEKNPKSAYAHYYAGLAYNGLKRPDKMLTHFEIFVKMKPDAPEARKVRAVLKTGR